MNVEMQAGKRVLVYKTAVAGGAQSYERSLTGLLVHVEWRDEFGSRVQSGVTEVHFHMYFKKSLTQALAGLLQRRDCFSFPAHSLHLIPNMLQSYAWFHGHHFGSIKELLYEFARATITKYLRLGGLNNRNISPSSGGEKSTTKSWQSWFLLRSLFLACRWLSSHCIFTWSFLCACVQISSS